MKIHLGWTGLRAPGRVVAAVDFIRNAAPSCEVTLHADESVVPAAWREGMDRLRLSPRIRSDVLRHCILREHGGLWLDADVRVLADPATWAADWDRYTAVRLADSGGFIGTDIIYVPLGWSGWASIDAYIEAFLREPPARYGVLHLAGRMIQATARLHPDLFAILLPGKRFPYDKRSFTAASVVARGFDMPDDPPPGLGDMVKAGLSAVGITEERVSRAIGRPCGCGKRAATLNELGHRYLGLPPGRATPAT